MIHQFDDVLNGSQCNVTLTLQHQGFYRTDLQLLQVLTGRAFWWSNFWRVKKVRFCSGNTFFSANGEFRDEWNMKPGISR